MSWAPVIWDTFYRTPWSAGSHQRVSHSGTWMEVVEKRNPAGGCYQGSFASVLRHSFHREVRGLCPPLESGWVLWPPDLQNPECWFLGWALRYIGSFLLLPNISVPQRMDCLGCHTPETTVLNKGTGQTGNQDIALVSTQFNLWLKNWIPIIPSRNAGSDPRGLLRHHSSKSTCGSGEQVGLEWTDAVRPLRRMIDHLHPPLK